ncbi:hypothetical protein BJI49_13795 [Acetobacter pasteurianus]|nr:hypothetical protein BJI49_13795 [Acetobacter pasteurianus]
MLLPHEDPNALEPGIKKLDVLPDKRVRVTIFPYHQKPDKPIFMEVTTLMGAEDIQPANISNLEAKALRKIIEFCTNRLQKIELEKIAS